MYTASKYLKLVVPVYFFRHQPPYTDHQCKGFSLISLGDKPLLEGVFTAVFLLHTYTQPAQHGRLRVANITDFSVEVRNSENDPYFSRFLYRVLIFSDFLRILQSFDFFQHFFFEYKYIWRNRNTSFSKMRGRYDRARCSDNLNHKKGIIHGYRWAPVSDCIPAFAYCCLCKQTNKHKQNETKNRKKKKLDGAGWPLQRYPLAAATYPPAVATHLLDP